MDKLPISPYKINLSTQSSPVGVKLLFKLKGGEVQKQKTLVTPCSKTRGLSLENSWECLVNCVWTARGHTKLPRRPHVVIIAICIYASLRPHTLLNTKPREGPRGEGSSHSSVATQPSSGCWQDLSSAGCEFRRALLFQWCVRMHELRLSSPTVRPCIKVTTIIPKKKKSVPFASLLKVLD